jgi:hypothetical protein
MTKRGDTMRWIIPKKKQDQAIFDSWETASNGDFNAPLSGNDADVCLMEPTCNVASATSPLSTADDDILAGRIKKFDDPDELIASLKRPW